MWGGGDGETSPRADGSCSLIYLSDVCHFVVTPLQFSLLFCSLLFPSGDCGSTLRKAKHALPGSSQLPEVKLECKTLAVKTPDSHAPARCSPPESPQTSFYKLSPFLHILSLEYIYRCPGEAAAAIAPGPTGICSALLLGVPGISRSLWMVGRI